MDLSRATFQLAALASAAMFCIIPGTAAGLVAYFVAPWVLLAMLAHGGHSVVRRKGTMSRLIAGCCIVWMLSALPVAAVLYAGTPWTSQFLHLFLAAMHWVTYLGGLKLSAYLASSRSLPFPAVFSTVTLVCATGWLLLCTGHHVASGLGDVIAELLGYWPGLTDVLRQDGHATPLPH